MNRRQLLIGGGALLTGLGTGAFASLRQMGSMADYDAAMAAIRAPLAASPQARELIRYATLAANGHNTQPWQFRTQADSITILPDLSRRTPVVDPDDHHLYVSLGCASENLSLASAAAGRPGEVQFDAAGTGSLVFRSVASTPQQSPLYDAIPHRQSSRSLYDGSSISAAEQTALAEAASSIAGVDLLLVTDRPKIGAIRDLVLSGNSAQMRDKAFVAELKHWLRFSPRQALGLGDGLFSASSGSPALPDWLGPTLFDLVFSEASENAKYASQINASSGLAVFVAEKADPQHWMQVGRACQRFCLQATALGLKTAFVNQPVETPDLRPQLASLIGLPDRRPDLVLRFGHGPALPFSARRPVEAVMVA